MSRDAEYATIKGAKCVGETAAAILVEVDGEEHWIPRSQLHERDNEVTEEGDEGDLVVAEWLALDKGLV